MSGVPSPHSERLREIRVYLAEDAAIDDMPRAHPSSPTPMLRDLLAAYDGFEEQLEVQARALRAIHFNADSWHVGEDGKARALNVISAWALHPESVPKGVGETSSPAKGRALRDEQFEYDYQMGTTPDE